MGHFEPWGTTDEQVSRFRVLLADDLDYDGHVDVVLSSYNPAQTHVYLGADDGVFARASTIEYATEFVTAMSVPGQDRKRLVTTHNERDGELGLHVWEYQETENAADYQFVATFASLIVGQVNDASPIDLNYDGNMDLLLSYANYGFGGGTAVLMAESNRLTKPIFQAFSHDDYFGPIHIGLPKSNDVFAIDDVDRDGDDDILMGGTRGIGIIRSQEGLREDVNRDGQIDGHDVVTLCRLVAQEDRHPTIFDLNGDSRLTLSDVESLFEQAGVGSFGDATLDGVFDTSDLVAVFSDGTYQTDGNVTDWTGGDWNCDGTFDASDLVQAFASGHYVSPVNVAQPLDALTARHTLSITQHIAAVDDWLDQRDERFRRDRIHADQRRVHS